MRWRKGEGGEKKKKKRRGNARRSTRDNFLRVNVQALLSLPGDAGRRRERGKEGGEKGRSAPSAL